MQVSVHHLRALSTFLFNIYIHLLVKQVPVQSEAFTFAYTSMEHVSAQHTVYIARKACAVFSIYKITYAVREASADFNI